MLYFLLKNKKEVDCKMAEENERRTVFTVPKFEIFKYDEEKQTFVPLTKMDVRVSDSQIVLPVDVQGVNVASNESFPVDQLGWKWKRLEATEAGDVSVKVTGGRVASLIGETEGVEIYIKDGDNQAWIKGNYELSHPINLDNNIKVNFSGAGVAWVLYK